MKMKRLEMRAHGHANRGNGICNANDMEKATWTYTNMREPQPHSYKRPVDDNGVPRNACTRARKPRQWHMLCNGMENDMETC